MNKIKMILISIVVVCLVLVLPLFFVAYTYNQTFGVRVNTDNDFYDFLKYEKPDFTRTQVKFKSNHSQELTGYFYEYPNTKPKGLIVVAHGMGDGHNNYLTEIEAFAANGYLVFAYDGTGTNESEGTKLIGLSQSPIDLQYALNYLTTIPAISELLVMLYGHSWGGFAVSALNNYPVKQDIKAIVSVAGFEKNSNVIKDLGRQIVGPFTNLLMPFVNFYEYLLFGYKAKNTGISGLSNTGAQVLIVHSSDDEIVNYEDNFKAYEKAFKDKPNFEFLSVKEHGHNVLIEPSANIRIEEIQKEKANLDKDSLAYQQLTYEEYLLTLRLDQEILNYIIEFYNTALN